ncbi:MAG: serine/threonine-protein phosphatase [Propionibacteriales bacterium]|nr:serine/threonine-protein phosphatase [Propionibacteriales bacterium]
MEYVVVTALSHDGLLRDHNEDSLVVGPWTTCATSTLTPQTMVFPVAAPLLVAVADGLGGHPAGDVASTLAVQELARVGPTLEDEPSVRAALDTCNRALYGAVARDASRASMGTTVAGVLLADDSAVVFNIGDSRVYAFGESGLSQVSVDDNPPLAPGQTHTSVLTRMLGGHGGYSAIEPHLTTRSKADGVRYLVCSDGLTDAVDDEAIERILREHRGGAAAYELWKAAMAAGGPDNITLAMAEIEDSEAIENSEAGD